MNPVADFLNEKKQLEKSAGFLSNLRVGVSGGLKGLKAGLGLAPTVGPSATGAERFGQMLGHTGTVAAAGSLITGGAAAAWQAAEGLKGKLQKPSRYKAMLAAHPSLQKEDASKVQLYYNSLNAMAPSVAAEPLLAGSFVRNMMAKEVEGGPAIPLETTKMMTDIQKSVSGAGRGAPPVLSPFMSPHVHTPREADSGPAGS